MICVCQRTGKCTESLADVVCEVVVPYVQFMKCAVLFDIVTNGSQGLEVVGGRKLKIDVFFFWEGEGKGKFRCYRMLA